MLEQVEAPEHKLKECEGVSNALWESLVCRVITLEVRMNVHDSGSSKAPYLDKWIIVIEKAQEQLGDAIKALDKEVKDSIAALRLK